MAALTEFENKLILSAPQARAGFENELAQQLKREFVQRRRAKQVLTARPRWQRRLSRRATLILAVVLAVGIGTVIAMNVFLKQFIDLDAGLKAIYEQGLGHEIGINQSHEGFTVTLEWAYADGNRLTLAYIIQGQAGTPYTNLESSVYRLSLRDTGEEIPFYQGMGALIDQNGDAVGWGAPPDTIVTSDRALEISTYDLSPINTDDSPFLNLRLEVAPYGVTLQQRTRLPIEQFDDMREGPETPFTFDFSVPLVDDQRVFNTALTTTDQDITIRLHEVKVAPSQTRVVICFTPPDPARQWTAIPYLTTDEGEVPGGGGVQPFMDGEASCQDYTYFAGMMDYTGEWRLEITELIGFGSGGDDQQRIPGSWVFEFTVP
ncbi:MAG: DUF4179 domain-containing protein [Anaerolineae bacterium]|nr:DUF4179 domain-containing protein [Anaerolineae bacterium]